MDYSIKHAVHFEDFKSYDTKKIRDHFLVEKIFESGKINMVYTHYDRLIIGGAMPVNTNLLLDSIDAVKSEFFLQRREMGIINVGGEGIILAGNTEYRLNYRDSLYLGKGTKTVEMKSVDKNSPAKFYFNSAPAHKEFPIKLITLADAEIVKLGSLECSNERQINKLLINTRLETCQLQMGMTELSKGSVWNTMPPHTHERRMEAYFYFNVPEGQMVCHFMGQPDETRHIWVQNEQVVISPSWSIHSAAGTSSYCFIWGMAGENMDFSDMDGIQAVQLK
ncbi:MAG: 5-dehydro-4-deoxy-D-glucuronate isomerase [Bacteroidales bacterium]|nr:5-dehydro-4-deoxy-D-glucuronate isomerase [Bacteroidales bacterium]